MTTSIPSIIPTLPNYDNYLSFKALAGLSIADGVILLICMAKIIHEICSNANARALLRF
jgi:hypothetical protein